MTDHTQATLKPQTVASAIAQIESCNFECEAGLLANNTGWKFLKAALNIGPEFWPGKGVWFQIDASTAGKTLTQWVHFYIVGCKMMSGTDDRYWVYSLSYDPPAPWHYGTTHFTDIRGDKLRLEKPVEEILA